MGRLARKSKVPKSDAYLRKTREWLRHFYGGSASAQARFSHQPPHSRFALQRPGGEPKHQPSTSWGGPTTGKGKKGGGKGKSKGKGKGSSTSPEQSKGKSKGKGRGRGKGKGRGKATASG